MSLHPMSRRARCAAFALVAAAALLGCGGGSTSTESPQQPQGPTENALAVSRPGELLAQVRRTLAARLAEQAQGRFDAALLPPAAPPLLLATAADGSRQATSGTRLQEAGVDEDDLIKSDGTLLYTLATSAVAPRLQAHRRLADGSLEATATLELPGPPVRGGSVLHGMQYSAASRRLAVLSETVSYSLPVDPCMVGVACITALPIIVDVDNQVQLQLVDAPAGGSLAAAERISLAGRLVGSRLIGQQLYVVSTFSPQLPQLLMGSAGAAEREAALAALTTAELLPTLRVGNAAPVPLLADTDCWVQPGNASPAVEITTITVFDLAQRGAPRRSRCVLGGTEAIYMSPASLYLATTRWGYPVNSAALRYPAQITTDLHKFALGTDGPAYRGSGTVEGHLGWDPQRKSYRLSEFKGDLRVLSFTGEAGWAALGDAAALPASPATLTILRESAGVLAELARLPNARRPEPLGHAGEQVHGVRLLGERGYVVTFRQTDPLYVLDLSDPADPKAVGELQMPGFSDHLVPLDGGLLFGVGREAGGTGLQGGVKVALFDLRDPTQPRLVASQVFGERGSTSALDTSAHGLNLLTVGGVARLALPISIADANWAVQAQGLQRFEVDTAAATLAVKPLIPGAVSGTSGSGPWAERSLQIGSKLYYLSQGSLITADW